MGISDLLEPSPVKILGIDASTTSIAFGIFENKKLTQYGKININGSDIYEKIYDARKKVLAMKNILKADYIAIEAAVFVKSPDIAIKLAYVYGAIISQLLDENSKVVTVIPTQWQNFIGNKPFSKDEKNMLKINNPGKSESWYKTKTREIRKQKTIDFVNNNLLPMSEIDDHDVGDAIGIAYFAQESLNSR
jgi:Holliday junction resolvasome RuvABC endonuclease subunit